MHMINIPDVSLEVRESLKEDTQLYYMPALSRFFSNTDGKVGVQYAYESPP